MLDWAPLLGQLFAWDWLTGTGGGDKSQRLHHACNLHAGGTVKALIADLRGVMPRQMMCLGLPFRFFAPNASHEPAMSACASKNILVQQHALSTTESQTRIA